MQKVGHLRYKTDPGETITFAEQSRTNVIDVSADGASLPQDRTSGSKIDITAGFSGNSGGQLVVSITGSNGGADSESLDQLGALPTCTERFTIL